MLENTDRKLLWLWLDVAFGPADKRLWDVMSYYDSVEEMCDDLLSLRCGYVTQQEAEKIACCTFFQAKQVAEYSNYPFKFKFSISIITYGIALFNSNPLI